MEKNNKMECELCEVLVMKQSMKKHMKSDKCLNRRRINRLVALAKDETISQEQFMHMCGNVLKNRPLNDTGFYSKAFLELLNNAVENAPK